MDGKDVEDGGVFLTDAVPPCLSLLSSLDEMLQQLKEISVSCFCRRELQPRICDVYDDVRHIVGDLRGLCVQQMQNSQEVVEILSVLMASREEAPGVEPPMTSYASSCDSRGLQGNPSSDDSQLRHSPGGRMQPPSEAEQVAQLVGENHELRLQLLQARVQLQDEVDARRTLEQHVNIMRQKDILRRISIQDQMDKVRVRDDQIRILEMTARRLSEPPAL